MKNLTSLEFRNSFRSTSVNFLDKNIMESVEFSPPQYYGRVLGFQRVSFKDIRIAGNQINNISFLECHGNRLTLLGLRTTALNIANVKISVLELVDCSINKLVVSRSEFQEINVVNCDIQESEFANLEQLNKLFVKIQNQTGRIFLDSINGPSDLGISVDSYNSVTISNVVGSNLRVSHCSKAAIDKITFNDCSVEADTAASVAITGSNIRNTLSTKTKSASSFKITQCTIKGLSSDLGQFNEFTNSKFESIDLSDRNNSIQLISIAQCELKNLVLPNIRGIEHLTLFEVVVLESLNLENGLLKANLNRVDLSMCALKIINTKFLSECEFVNIQWPKNHSLYEYTKELKAKSAREKLSYLLALKEAYRQLKVVSIDQHNKIDAMLFQKHEIKIHYEIISIYTWDLGSRSRWRNLGDYLILKTNSLFSDFGLSWTRPLFWWITFHLFLFWLLIENFDLGIRVQMDHDWQAFYEGLKLYLKLLFPIHDFEITGAYNERKVAVWGVIDFVMRISSSYFLYYFIRGTRKFNLS